MAIKKHIPNIITILNLVSGCIAIIFIFDGELKVASYLIFLAALFDFLDGMAARVLKVKSDIGKELDSLADIVSFGLVPGFIMMKLLQSSLGVTDIYSGLISLIPYLALLIPVFSALRLAKFNIDNRQTQNFIGLPTPANAILIASLPLIMVQKTTLNGMDTGWLVNFISNPYVLTGLTVLLSFLLVAELSLFSLKINKNEPAKNRFKYIFIVFSCILILLFYFAAIPVIMIFYILFSLLFKSKI
jgi:CDP-diacylglycerol--serine O-phosphatidyltransferase